MLPDLHDSPFYIPRTCQHFNFVDFIALNVLICVRIERGKKSWNNWVVIGVSDASFWIRLSHYTNKRMLANQDTFDQLVVTHAWERRIFGIVFGAKIFKAHTVSHLLFIKSSQIQ